ncbi:MAG: hypothetical protein HYY03_02745 [Chloroflexi bacterium]|nr:hypothetical protein [Chloroflexota bacterium]
MNTEIRAVRARQVLDSRGNPTIEVEVTLAGGAVRGKEVSWPLTSTIEW